MSDALNDALIPRTGIVGRYAPSPTGPQHFGNLRTALLAWLQVRIAGGTFLVRMEDLDTQRVRAGSADGIMADLAWLGLDWDEGPDTACDTLRTSMIQSERHPIYAAAVQQLAEKGLNFSCFCSRKDIREAASAPHGSDGPLYPGTCRAVLEPRADRDPAIRVRVDDARIEFVDEIAGRSSHELARTSGDFVIRRADGIYAYQLAVAVDDGLMGVTDVLRGDDLRESTPRQIFIARALGLPVPRYWHVPVLRDACGERLAKRLGAQSLEPVRASGRSPESVVGELAAGIGLVGSGVEISARELAAGLTPAQFAHSLREHVREDALSRTNG